MKIEKIHYTSHFKRPFKRLPRKQKKLIDRRVQFFRQNCFDSRLKTHKLKGKLEGLYSFSITSRYRIVFEFTDENEVVFHDAGDHRIYR